MGDIQKRQDGLLETHRNDPYVPRRSSSLLDFLSVLAKRWKLIFFLTFLTGVAVIAFSLYTMRMPPDSEFNPLPDYYRPSVDVLIRGSDTSSPSQGSAGDPLSGPIQANAGPAASPQTNAALAQRLLEQNTIIDRVISEFGILAKNDFRELPQTSARRMIRGPLAMSYDPATSVLTIAYEHVDPVFATNILNRIVQLLEARLQELNLSQIANRRGLLEEQITRAESDLASLTQELIAFQRQYGITDLAAQAEQTVSQIGSLSGQVYEKELELAALLEYYPEDHPEVQRAQNEIGHLRSLIGEIRGGFNEFSAIGIPQSQIATVAVQYEELQAEVLVQREILAELRTRFEKTRIEEADNGRVFQVIEAAEVPEATAGPKRVVISAMVTAGAFLVSLFLSFLLEYFEKARHDPVEAEKLAEIRKALGGKKAKKELSAGDDGGLHGT